MFCETTSLEECANNLGAAVPLVFVTDSEKGCIVVEDGNLNRVEGFSISLLDTVGAGDAFAGGVLYGLSHGFSPTKAARWGNYLASRVVEINGPRLHKPVADQVATIIENATAK
jgi:sugar/nucleoside kinase (ribokinase family)